MTNELAIYLRLIAAKAEEMALRAESRGFWEGEAEQGLNELEKALASAKAAIKR